MSAASLIANRFSTRWNHYYARAKIVTDPAYPAVGEVLLHSQHPLLDVGCGLGLLAFWLREHGFTPPIHGCDVDAKKIRVAQAIADTHYPQVQFSAEDAGAGLPQHQGNVCLLDVLQYLTFDKQRSLLHAAAACVPEGAHLLIRSSLAANHWRFRWGQAGDQLARRIGWITAPPRDYPTRESLIEILREVGLIGDFRPLWGRTPFHNYFGHFTRVQSA